MDKIVLHVGEIGQITGTTKEYEGNSLGYVDVSFPVVCMYIDSSGYLRKREERARLFLPVDHIMNYKLGDKVEIKLSKLGDEQ